MTKKMRTAQKPTLINRVAIRLYAGIAAAVMVTISASVVGILAFERINSAQQDLQESGIDPLIVALETTELAGDMVAMGTRLVTAPSMESYESIEDEYREIEDKFKANMDDLDTTITNDSCVVDSDYNDRCTFNDIRKYGDVLSDNLSHISGNMPRYFELNESLNEFKDRMDVQFAFLAQLMDKAIDDRFFFVMEGYNDLSDLLPGDDHLSKSELINYRHLRLLKSSMNSAFDLLSQAYVAAFAATDPRAIKPLSDQFEFTLDRIDVSLNNIRELDNGSFNFGPETTITNLLNQVTDNEIQGNEFINGIRDFFDQAEERLVILENQQETLENNTLTALDLLTAVGAYAVNTEKKAANAAAVSYDTINTARFRLISISIFGVIGALLVSWLYVGRIILRRITKLSHRMRELVGGDLETEVEVKGRDELADMASALEVFRQHALEVQRLNLLEKLTAELVDKNDQLEAANGQLENTNKKLETTLNDLGKAQNQIVAREKLAALGEVTAGVAHEIRNPLNFIKNFSEVSEELVDELKEALAENEKSDDEESEYLAEILGDLTENMQRIINHSKRANRIVADMLRMGRGVNEIQFTNINTLLSDHAKLAYHSARASDPDFVLDLKEEFDPNMGELEVTSQDLGRVFVNLVTNAGYAANQKYKELGGASTEDDYLPKVVLTTARNENEAVIKVWDNGVGIPQDIIDKVFDPFFTTKPTDQGTGLGLSMSHDIVRSHGGTLQVTSKPGECTEFTVTLPLAPPTDTVTDEEVALGVS